MGDALGYLAIKGKSKDEVWSNLRLTRAPEHDIDGLSSAAPNICM